MANCNQATPDLSPDAMLELIAQPGRKDRVHRSEQNWDKSVGGRVNAILEVLQFDEYSAESASK